VGGVSVASHAKGALAICSKVVSNPSSLGWNTDCSGQSVGGEAVL